MKRNHSKSFTDTSIRALTHFKDSTGCAAAIDLYIEGAVSGQVPARGLIIEGCVGAGKRQLARAAAAEFGVPVAELDSRSLGSAQRVMHNLARNCSDSVLVTHNFDELPDQLKATLSHLMLAGTVRPRGSQVETIFDDAADNLWRCQAPPVMFIATTTDRRLIPYALANMFPIFTLGRQIAGTFTSMKRRLTAIGVSCTDRTIKAVSRFIYLCPGDRFETVVAMMTTQADRCEGRCVDDAMGARFVAMCWGTLAPAAIARSVATHIGEQRNRNPDIAKVLQMLRVPKSLRREVMNYAAAGLDRDAQSENTPDAFVNSRSRMFRG